MNQDIERLLDELTPRGPAPELRARVLDAVANVLADAPTPTRRRFRVGPGMGVAAALLAGLMMNYLANASVDRRLKAALGPPPVPRQAAEIAAEITVLTDSRTGRWAFEQLTASRSDSSEAQPYPVRLQELIRRSPEISRNRTMNRLKRSVKWIAISAAALIAILLLLNALFVWSTGTALERRLLELRQAGDPVQLSDLGREPIPPEQNADVYLRRAADDLDAIQNELLAMYPKAGVPAGPLSKPEQEKMGKLFAAYPRVMPLLEQAAACPDYDPGIDGSLPPSRFIRTGMESVRQAPTCSPGCFKARSALLVAEGRIDDAVTNSISDVAAGPDTGGASLS